MSQPQADIRGGAGGAEARQPVAQITGRRLFWGLSFRVTPDTLDPRPETEALVAEALQVPFLKDARPGHRHRLHPALLPEGDADGAGTGTDISPAALAVAWTTRPGWAWRRARASSKADWFDG
jgi:release factor glutamine methyltransferase